MKKKILALVCAMTMVLGMSMSVCAAGSSSASSAAAESSTDTTTNLVSESSAGQTFSAASLAEFADTTTVAAGPSGASVSELDADTAAAMIAEAYDTKGTSTFVAALVDLKGGAGTYTLTCPNVWAGQKVTILHQKADGSYEYIAADKVENNKVTFTMTSTSPVAILVNGTAPKTGDVVAVMALLAAVCAGGAVVTGRKAR